jgi:hypothetical protein
MILQWVESQTSRRFRKDKRKISVTEGNKAALTRHFIDNKDESYGDRHGTYRGRNSMRLKGTLPVLLVTLRRLRKGGTELQKRPRDAPARRRDHRRPAIRDRCDEPLAQQETH